MNVLSIIGDICMFLIALGMALVIGLVVTGALSAVMGWFAFIPGLVVLIGLMRFMGYPQ